MPTPNWPHIVSNLSYSIFKSEDQIHPQVNEVGSGCSELLFLRDNKLYPICLKAGKLDVPSAIS